MNIQEKQDARVNGIVKNALKLFAVNGYNLTSIDDICKATKISHGLIYHYFRNKDEILEVIVERAKTYFYGSFKESKVHYQKDAIGALSILIDIFLKALHEDDDPLYFMHLFLTIHHNNNRCDLIFEKYADHKSPVDILREVFINLQKAGNISQETNIESSIVCFFTLLRGLSFAVIKSKDREKIRKVLPSQKHILRMFIEKEKID